jgi:spore coat polysaccharide biosynthesis predicted glycosyltransferase SpsG
MELRANVIRAAGPAMYDLVLGTINALVAAQIANDSGFLGHADLAGLASRLEHGLAEALNG